MAIANFAENFYSQLTSHNFFEKSYGKNFFIDSLNNYDDLLNIFNINDYFNNNNLRFPEVTMFSKGTRLGPEQLRQDDAISHNLIDKEKLWKHYDGGATIKIENAHLAFFQIENFCKNLGKKIKSNVKAGIYITPPNAKASVPHYDMHDIFVIQVYGNKTWKLFNTAFENPIEGQLLRKTDMDRYNQVEPTKQLTVTKGDLIYIPRGFVHDAHTQASTSIHLTISLHPQIKLSLLKEIIEGSAGLANLREQLEPEINKEKLKKELLDSVSQLIDNYFSENNYLENYANRQEFKNRFLSVEKLDTLNEETTICGNKNDLVGIFDNLNGQIELRTGIKSVLLPCAVKKTVTSFFDRDEFCLKELEDELNYEDKKTIANLLIKEGLLYIK